MQRLWIHIGMQKTGTSAVQAWLAGRDADLHQRGLLYFRPLKNRPGASALVEALERDPGRAARMIARLRAGADAGAADILISSEDFSTRPPQIVAPLIAAMAGMQTTVLVWLRRQDLFAEALTKQWIKWNGSAAADPDRLMRSVIAPLLDYDRLLSDWQAALPGTRILPQIYAEQAPGGPAPDSIAALLGAMDRPDLIPPDSGTHRTNVSPPAALVDLYRGLDDARRVRDTNRALMKAHPSRFAGRTDLFTPGQRQAIRDACAASNERLRARWFSDRATVFAQADPDPGPGAGAEAVAQFRTLYDAPQEP